MPRYHRIDEYGRPTDKSLLDDGYDVPVVSGKLYCLGLLLAPPAAGFLYFIFS